MLAEYCSGQTDSDAAVQQHSGFVWQQIFTVGLETGLVSQRWQAL